MVQVIRLDLWLFAMPAVVAVTGDSSPNVLVAEPLETC
jgi:hypothetical protein